MPTTSVRWSSFSSSSSLESTDSDGSLISLWETISASAYRESMRGLKIWTRCFAMIARRSRRMSSSLFPENMLPQITSIQPSCVLTSAMEGESYQLFGCQPGAL